VTRVPSDGELFARGAETLVASWNEYARWSTGAAVHRLAGVDVAVFPSEPERAVYNNALVTQDLPNRARADALAALERAYAKAGVTRFAVWAVEHDDPLRTDLEQRGYRLDTSTLAMGMALADLRTPPQSIDLGRADWSEHLRIGELPPNFLLGTDPRDHHVRVARLGGENVATALAFDHRGDCGIYNVGTLGHARRRGLGTALTVLQLYDARARGCVTASLQATAEAERMYGSIGFRDLGRIFEYKLEDAAASPLSSMKSPAKRAFSSGRPDSNRGPLVPQTSALTRLRHAPWLSHLSERQRTTTAGPNRFPMLELPAWM
jgi:ribosomal protein S18 acetylase RimI-like enzyme